MTDALLGTVIGNLQAFMHEQLATFWGVDSQIQKLSRILTAIRAVLRDAEEKQITSHAIKDWLQKLSDAAYVLDDILDECSIKSIGPQHSGVAQDAICLTPFHPKKILLRYDIGKRMKDIIDRFHDIDEERRMFELRVDIIGSQLKDDEWRHTSSIITESEVYGRDHDKEKIVEFLLMHAGNNEDLSIYPIVGTGGLGKTTLAQIVFNDQRVSRHFDLKIWVCVSNDFSIERILQSIIESATIQNPNLSTLESMQKKVQEVLLRKRYLLVLDDMWNENQVKWDKLKCLLQCGSGIKGASILVTTQLDNVASIMGTYPTHHLLGLSEDDNWSLFKHHAFGPNGEERADLVKIGKEIVKKCAGSPLASKVLGSLLRFKSEEKQWRNVQESKLWYIAKENSIMRALRISYINLELPLRRCFLFCAIFPEDFHILKQELIHLWMANGLIESRGSLDVEDVGDEVWNELYRRSFFQEVKTDVLGQVTFKMHDLVRDLAQSIMGEECVVSKSGKLTNLSTSVHYIGCSAHYQPLNLNMSSFKKVESLRSLLEFDPPYTNFRGLPLMSSLRALRSSSSELSTLKNLTHLRYLNLCDSYITTLPKSVSKLQKLQVLKLEHCGYLSHLPKHLTQLQDLRHLVIENCPSLMAMPPKIGKLKSLKTLSTFIVDSKIGFGLVELCDLQLGGKLHIKGLENVTSECDAKDANLMSKKALNQLYLSWGSNVKSQYSDADADADAEKVLEALQPHSNIKSFGMRGYKGMQLASWMRNTLVLEGLVDVILWDCKNCEWLPPLGKLPHLTRLCVCGVEHVKHMDDDSYDGLEDKAFKSLKKLTLRRLPNLEKMLRDDGVEVLPLLFELCISSVPKFEFPYLPSLERLQVESDGLNEDEASFPEGVGRNMPHLKTLCITDFHKLKVLPDELGSLSALQELKIEFCDERESFSEHVLQGLSSLRTLEIWYCRKLKSLSEGVRHLTCLDRLEIWNCPELVSLPSTMNQLTSLHDMTFLRGYPDLNRKLPAGLQHIPSLQSLTLCGLDSLPDWLGDMISLQQLYIVACPELRSLPSSIRQLTNLHKLTIHSCPKLQKRCKKESGEDWRNIANIPEFELVPIQEKTFCERVRFKFTRKINRDHPPYYSGTRDIEFDRMVDEL